MKVWPIATSVCFVLSISALAGSLNDTKKVSFVSPNGGSAKDTIKNLSKNEGKVQDIYPYENTDIKTVKSLNKDLALSFTQTPMLIVKTTDLTNTGTKIKAKTFEINSNITENTNVIATSDQASY